MTSYAVIVKGKHRSQTVRVGAISPNKALAAVFGLCENDGSDPVDITVQVCGKNGRVLREDTRAIKPTGGDD